MVDPTLPLPGLSPVSGKAVAARFDGGALSSDAGVLALREIEARLGVAERLAACLDDPRAAGQTIHSLAEIIRFRLLTDAPMSMPLGRLCPDQKTAGPIQLFPE